MAFTPCRHFNQRTIRVGGRLAAEVRETDLSSQASLANSNTMTCAAHSCTMDPAGAVPRSIPKLLSSCFILKICFMAHACTHLF
jgi:hypothetical protein